MNSLCTFGQKLKSLRQKQGLTIYKLASLAGVPFTLISALENSRKTVGVNNATKIGRGLGLSGQWLRDFVYLAVNNSKSKVLEEFQNYPADLLNLLPSILKDAGIESNDIKGTLLRPDFESDPDAVMFLKGTSRKIYVHMEVVEQ